MQRPESADREGGDEERQRRSVRVQYPLGHLADGEQHHGRGEAERLRLAPPRLLPAISGADPCRFELQAETGRLRPRLHTPVLANPPLAAPKPLRPIINAAARRIANRFISSYTRVGPDLIDPATLDWYRTLQGCRILIDLSGWRAVGELDAHRGHPWLATELTLQSLLAP